MVPLAVEYIHQIFLYLDSEVNQGIYSHNLDYLIFNDLLKQKFFNILLKTSKDLTSILIHKERNNNPLDSNLIKDYDTPSDYYELFGAEGDGQRQRDKKKEVSDKEKEMAEEKTRNHTGVGDGSKESGDSLFKKRSPSEEEIDQKNKEILQKRKKLW